MSTSDPDCNSTSSSTISHHQQPQPQNPTNDDDDNNNNSTTTRNDQPQPQPPTDPNKIPTLLPARKVFPIQIGDQLFRLSGASISSDAPSYISQFFSAQIATKPDAEPCRTLYVDRDPNTFADISRHLQGYHIEARDGAHFVKLFSDAQFFSLPRLTAQLSASTIYVRVGEQEFRIPKDLFSSGRNPGDWPNYFSLGFSSFFSTLTDRLPGLSQQSLIRPPSLLPPSVPTRSARIFADLLHLLQGYELRIRDESHRAELLRDARYYHLKGVEQRLIPHRIAFNLRRQRSEILLRLEDVHKNGVSFVADRVAGGMTAQPSLGKNAPQNGVAGPGWICYQRPYVDAEAHNLIIEVGGEESTTVELEPTASSTSNSCMARVTLHNDTEKAFARLLSAIADRMSLPVIRAVEPMTPGRNGSHAGSRNQSQYQHRGHNTFRMHIGPDADVVVNGHRQSLVGHVDAADEMDVDDAQRPAANGRKVRHDNHSPATHWVVNKAQWRLRAQPRNGIEVILDAIKIEAYSSESSRNAASDFLM
ncbi:hypothetical protein CERZMDRAFT_33612 [Cercospora zeae-maydis SCOH1-5]|uniref:Potassium channel tetramerisation-type BTB domain-containing protein n=1 Tax=Cercospora zeae-maydis SCOH1-5 TaxID=717836 RepID=A0A6A6FS21_9PEZI|nr:hypothetical protein CERZMDRAFT_33612 [Cercospora zeae-maydis SCOH1-5]